MNMPAAHFTVGDTVILATQRHSKEVAVIRVGPKLVTVAGTGGPRAFDKITGKQTGTVYGTADYIYTLAQHEYRVRRATVRECLKELGVQPSHKLDTYSTAALEQVADILAADAAK